MISYKPFQKLLIDRNVKKKELVEKTNISWATLAKFNTNEYVSLQVIDKICEFLNCQPGDIMKYIPDEE